MATGSERILVIDDDRTALTYVKALLGGEGYDVFTAPDALQGPMVARRAQPDLVVLDLAMPGGGGMRAAPVDERALSSLKALDREGPGFLSELVREFDEGIRGRLGDMQLAAGENDGAGLCGAAHSVKGSAGIVGARGMASLCQHLERLAADGQTTEADALIASLAHEHEAVLSVLREAAASV